MRMPEDIDKQYDPHRYEKDIYNEWEKSGVFSPQGEGKPFVIMLPPPNITGSLHMGHALQDTIMDILARYNRMKGNKVLWLPGTDHAAIATNKVLEEKLRKNKQSSREIGRQAYIKQAQEWYAKVGNEIVGQMRSLGCSCDWSRARFTMDENYNRAVQESFVSYYKKGYIYRGDRIVNWDPNTQTTVSDLEIEWKSEKVPFYTFQYGPFQIGTVRPETKFGDKYVVVHPTDERYGKYDHGDTFECEWINGPITATIIKDEAADPSLGTGAMTITPWHTQVDFEIAARHKLDKEQVIGLDGKLLPMAGEFTGMGIEEARPKIVNKLKDKGLLIGVEENYEHNVALNDRGKGIIEPQIMRQWFVDMSKLKTETIEVALNELVQFMPSRWKEHFIEWMNNVHDWNINRQIWLGHRLPVWWKGESHGTDNEEGNYVVSIEKPTESDSATPGRGRGTSWQQDPDVLDTWFSSALWPFATLGWPENTKDLEDFYPTTVLVTGRDILYLWVARMIFSGLELMSGKKFGNREQKMRIPFKDVFIHPTVLDKDGQRMSKSLGTGVDPLKLIEEFGADATRFGLMYQMNYDSQAMRYDNDAIKSARNFANKIWNIARLLERLPDSDELTVADNWIQQKGQHLTFKVENLIKEYKFGEAARLIYDFVWRDYADWYLEILKVQGSKKIAVEVWQRVMATLHPFMPFITEVLWQNNAPEKPLISSKWPEVDIDDDKTGAAADMSNFQDVVEAVRSVRSMLKLPAKAVIILHVSAVVMPLAVEKLCRASLIAKKTPNLKEFPTRAGATIAIGSEHVNEESIATALEKFVHQAEALKTKIQNQQEMLGRMQGRALAGAIKEKEEILKQLNKQVKELENSIAVLS